MNDHHRWLIGQSVDHAQFLDRQVEGLENILAEIGADMSRFATGDKRCKWARICPGNNRSAGNMLVQKLLANAPETPAKATLVSRSNRRQPRAALSIART